MQSKNLDNRCYNQRVAAFNLGVSEAVKVFPNMNFLIFSLALLIVEYILQRSFFKSKVLLYVSLGKVYQVLFLSLCKPYFGVSGKTWHKTNRILCKCFSLLFFCMCM